MARPTSPRKVWLILSLAVLLLHLALLQTLPLNLSGGATDTSPLTFSTRTLVNQPQVDAAPPKAPNPAPMRKPATKISPRPAPSAAPVPRQELASDAGESTGTQEAEPAVLASEGPPTESKPASATAPQEVASAPVPPETGLASAPRPPRAKATAFNADGLPASAKLIFKVLANKFPYSLSGELVWRQADQQYQASLSIGAFGQTRTQTSRGHIGPNGLAPERFSDKYRSEVAAHFNWSQGKVTFSANTPDAPLLSGAQDRLSVLVQLAALVAGAPQQFPPATTLTLQTVGPRDADLWLFTVGNMEPLVLPGGTVQGLKLTRILRHQYDQQVEIWLAPSLGYLPARIRILESNGDFIDQQWQATEPVGPP
jgi:hypothetical protein